MRIGIITFHFVLNYGGVLQAYALSKCLKKMGHDAYFIDYQPDYHVKRYQWKWDYCGLHPTNIIFAVLRKRFNDFTSKHLKLTSRLYNSLEDLQAGPPEAEAYICGSDQIWNAEITNFDPAYFLCFAPENIKKISYAASFGKTNFTEMQQRKLREYIEVIQSLSVREQNGVNFISDFTDRKAACVLDPTLLITDYDEVTSQNCIKDEYILVVNLLNNPLINQTADFISKQLCLKKVVLNKYSLKDLAWDEKRLYPSPDGYLGLIKNAKFVVTNSFHGTVFSIVFKKKFIVTALSGHSSQKNSRMTELLNKIGLSRFFINDFDEKFIMESISADTDWSVVCTLLARLREESLFFLKNALDD